MGTWRQLKSKQKAMDKAYLISLIEAAGGQHGLASQRAGLNRTAWYVLIHKHGLMLMSERQRKTIAGRRAQMQSERRTVLSRAPIGSAKPS